MGNYMCHNVLMTSDTFIRNIQIY